MRRSAVLAGLAAIVWGAAAQAQPWISIQTTVFSGAVMIDVTVSSPPAACSQFAITRSTVLPCTNPTTLTLFSNSQGTDFTFRYFDTSVQPSTAYQYAIGSPANPACTNLACGGWTYPTALVVTGPGPVPIARGQLSSNRDAFADFAVINCMSCPPANTVDPSGTGAQYVDSGTDVVVYGTFTQVGCQQGWMNVATAVLPLSCTLDVEPSAWGTVKSLYR